MRSRLLIRYSCRCESLADKGNAVASSSMFPLKVFRSEAAAANLIQQIRWHDGLYCPHCRGESVINYGSYRLFQRYRCKDCGPTFNDKAGTILPKPNQTRRLNRHGSLSIRNKLRSIAKQNGSTQLSARTQNVFSISMCTAAPVITPRQRYSINLLKNTKSTTLSFSSTAWAT